MLAWEFIKAWAEDWTGRMSGFASIVLAFWVAFFPPTIDEARWLLLATAAACFILGSYHIWTKQHKATLGKPDLTFDIEKTELSNIQLISNAAPAIPYVIKVSLCIRISNNNNLHPVNLWDMKLAIISKTRGRERAVPLKESRLIEILEGSTRAEFSAGLTIGAGRRTKVCQAFVYVLGITSEQLNTLNRKCFLRLTMEAAGQPPYSANIYPDWRGLRQSTNLTLTPETKVQYQVHTLEVKS